MAARSVVAYSGSLSNTRRLFNAQLDFLDEREEVHAYLAEALPSLGGDSWRVLPDGTMETRYRLKPELVWQDGTPLAAEDFVFAWQVYATPDLGATGPPVGRMQGVTAPDPSTVSIHWKSLYPGAASLDLGFQALPRHLLKQPFAELDPQAFASLPFWTAEYVGLGPYRIERWDYGTAIEAAAFSGYVLGTPRIPRIRLVFISDPNTAIANLLSGEAHYVSEAVLFYEEGAGLEAQWAKTGGGTVLYSPVVFRTTAFQFRPEFVSPRGLLDVRILRALARGMDSLTAAEASTGGRGMLMWSLTPPTKPFYAEIERVIHKHPYDQRSAQALLEEAGLARAADGFYAGRDGEPFRVEVATDGGAGFERDNAVFVESLRRAGVDATSRVVPVAQLRDTEARALLPGLSSGGGSPSRHDQFISAAIPRPENRWQGNNRGGWSNADYDRVWQQFSIALDSTERVALNAELERIYTTELPSIPHFFAVIATAHVAALQGPAAVVSPDAGRGIHHVHLWQWRSWSSERGRVIPATSHPRPQSWLDPTTRLLILVTPFGLALGLATFALGSWMHRTQLRAE
jgi:peptide/nickel transport system substrate-binding protein